jgi:hypothetical protein
MTRTMTMRANPSLKWRSKTPTLRPPLEIIDTQEETEEAEEQEPPAPPADDEPPLLD